MILTGYRTFLTLTLLVALGAPPPRATAAAPTQTYDVVVYGGTSAGIAAAIQTTRLGKSVVLIEPGHWVGGLTTGGLGATDIGNKQAIGGIAREFYARIWKYYDDPANWTHETRDEYLANRADRQGSSEPTMWTFEPHAADAVFADMLREAAVPVVKRERLNLDDGVVKEGPRIVAIKMESGANTGGACSSTPPTKAISWPRRASATTWVGKPTPITAKPSTACKRAAP